MPATIETIDFYYAHCADCGWSSPPPAGSEEWAQHAADEHNTNHHQESK